MSSHKNHIIPDVYLKPGEAVISEKAAIISTVLGSCISITMFSPFRKIGAICHNLLPRCKENRNCNDSCPEAFRYVECTVKRMTGEFTSRGISVRELEVKIFGGADMFKISTGSNSAVSVGRQNIETALQMLSDLGLKISASDTGGSRGRKLIFHTNTGEVYLKRLNKSEIIPYECKS